MKTFKQFIKEMAKRKKEMPKPSEYFHIGPANLRPGNDLMSMSDQHGKDEAFNKFVRKWKPLDSPGVEQDIERHISNVHVTGPGYFGIGKDGRPKKGAKFSQTEYGGRKKTALYRITPDEDFHQSTQRFEGDSFDAPSSDHYITPRVPSRLISHKWNEDKEEWEPFN